MGIYDCFLYCWQNCHLNIINPLSQVDQLSTFSKYCEIQSVTYTLFLQIVEDNSVLGKCRNEVYVEEFFDALQEVHSMQLLHAGYRKTFEKV